jgi:hypothetical protein
MSTLMSVALEVWGTQPLPPSSFCFEIQINQCRVMVCTNVRSSKTFRRADSLEFSFFLIRTRCPDTIYKNRYLGFEVPTAVVGKISVLRDITPSTPLEVDRHFGATCRFHHEGRRICSACYQIHYSFFLGLFFDTEDGGDLFLRNVGWLSTDYTALFPRRENSSRTTVIQNQLNGENPRDVCSLGWSEIPLIFWHPKVHCRVYKSPSLYAVLNQFNPHLRTHFLFGSLSYYSAIDAW